MTRAMAADPSISQRKAEHLAIAASGQADFAIGTLLDQVHLVHDALPELAVADVDLRSALCGKPLRAPLLITGMTGGTPTARAINRDLAVAAERCGVAFGVGSQRAMAEHPELADTYAVRDVAPTALVLGNLGVMQARALGVARCRELVQAIGADALAVHLNPAQELAQPGGDRDFTGGLDVIGRLVDGLGLPVLVKETGCGLAPRALARLRALGVAAVDVAGAGGTSWVAVERLRAPEGSTERRIGDELRDWGLPTAVSVACAAQAGLPAVASGGIRHGLDAARALALGAVAAGAAAPLLRAQQAGGVDGVVAWLDEVTAVIRSVCVLTGSRSLAELRAAPRHLGPALAGWLHDLGPAR